MTYIKEKNRQMNSLLLTIILIPAVEIYLFIKIGALIGALNTVLLIFLTAIVGIYYARAEGLNTLNHGLRRWLKMKCQHMN